jgi:hypothetical protein
MAPEGLVAGAGGLLTVEPAQAVAATAARTDATSAFLIGASILNVLEYILL